ncbi:hypothetical protein MBANPS3_010494, partial [Mucor bainieri]
MATTPDPSWVQVLSGGHSKKVTNAQPTRATDDKFRLIPEVIYEHDDLRVEVLTRKAAAILQQALTHGSVLFTFPNKTFDHRTEAYRLIKTQISPLVQFRPLSLYHQKSSSDLLLEAKFDNSEDAQLAISHGITHNEIVYKASVVKDNNEGQLTYVHKRHCFKCPKLCHIAKFCREEQTTTFVDDLEEYET